MLDDNTPVRVLLVDDDPAILKAYGSALTRSGALVEYATNGKEAEERVGAGAYDVIVSDINMPQMTGIEFLKAVRAHDIDVPVILMTGGNTLEFDVYMAQRAVDYGAFRYLTKPVTNADLWDAVRSGAALHKMATLKQEALDLPGMERGRLGERAALEVRFSWG